MAGATAGKDGALYIAGSAVTLIDEWQLSRSRGMLETTALGDDWANFITGIKEWSATFKGSLDATDAQQAALMDQLEDGAAAKVAVQLYHSASSYWAGSAWVESDQIGVAVRDKVTINGTLRGDGELTHTIA